MTQLSERNVLVTGAASGIGLLLAERFAARGARTILWDVDAVALEAALARVAAAGGGPAAAYVCDLSDRQSIESTAARVVARHGRVDVLVNNAGIVNGKRLLELSDAEIERTFAVNTLALFRTVRAFLPGMLAAGEGHVVTIASAAGIAAAPRLADYSASKAAAIAFDEALRLELARDAAPVRAFVKSTWLLRLLPVAWFDAAMGFFGITRSMDDFTGRGRTPRS